MSASDFFGDIGKLDRGGLDHPFFRTPAVFTYRHPFDMLVSEASYLKRGGNSALTHYLRALDEPRRLDELIDGPLLGEFWRRTVEFAPYLELPNVIPLSFEELVGPKGGGSREAQLRAIWSLQLKLHIPGSPAYYAEVAFDEATPTFHKGQIGGHLGKLSAAQRERLADFPQDFMHRFGYDIDDEIAPGYLPRFADAFRSRPLRLEPLGLPEPLPAAERESPDCAAVYRFAGYLIAEHRGRWYAAPRHVAPFNPELERAIPHLHGARVLTELLEHLRDDLLDASEELGEAEPGVALFDLTVPQLVEEGYKGCNIVRRGDRYTVHVQARPSGGAPEGYEGRVFAGVAEARAAVDSWAYAHCNAVPYLLREEVNGYNVVLYAGRYLCVPCGGPLAPEDYAAIVASHAPDCSVYDSLAEALAKARAGAA